MKKIIDKVKNVFLTKKFGSFFVIGLFNTGCSQLLYMVFVVMNIAAGLSSILSDAVTMVFSYFLNMKFTYQLKPSLKTFVTFPLSYIPGWIVNALMVILCVDVLMIDKLWAKLVSIPITVPLNFVVMSFVMKVVNKSK